jgi:hypothetical protein
MRLNVRVDNQICLLVYEGDQGGTEHIKTKKSRCNDL